MTYSVKKIAAFLLALAMMVNLLPAGVLAEDYNKNSDPIEINFTKGGGAKNAGPIPLTDLTEDKKVYISSITSDGSVVDPDTGIVERDQQIGININFTIDKNKLYDAQTNSPWTYDVSDYIGDSHAILNLLAIDDGVLLNGTETVGRYTVTSAGLIQLYPDPEWINAQDSGVGGSFSITAQLNETVNASQDSNSFQFPGASATTVTFLTKEISADKSVHSYKGADAHATASTDNLASTSASTSANADGGIVTVSDAGDGSYRLFYRIRVQMNSKSNATFLITDTLEGGQKLITDTFKVYVERGGSVMDELPQVSSSDPLKRYFNPSSDYTGFTMDLKSALKDTYGNDSSKYIGKNIWIEYYTRLTEEDIWIIHNPGSVEDTAVADPTKIQKNKATVTYDGKTLEPSTEITPKYVKQVSPFKEIGNEAGMYYPVTGTDDNNQMALGQQNEVHFLTGGTLSSPATSLTVTDNATGVKIIEDSIRINIGPDSNNEFHGYVDYKDWKASGALLLFDETEKNSFTFDVYKFIKYLVEKSEYYRDLYDSHYFVSGNDFKLFAGTEFKVYYKAEVLPDYMPGTDKKVSNTATWNAYDNPEPVSVSTKLISDTPEVFIEKDVYRFVNDNPVMIGYNENGDPDYNISAGRKVRFALDVFRKSIDGSYMDLSGATVTDTIQNFIKSVPSTIEIYRPNVDPDKPPVLVTTYYKDGNKWVPDLGFSITMPATANAAIGIAEGIQTEEDTAVTSLWKSYNLFTLTFPSNGTEYKNKYSIVYDVEVDDEMPEGNSLFGTGNYGMTNNGGIGVGTSNASVTKKVNIWYDFPGVQKEFITWDKTANEAIWEILVTLPDGITSIEQPVQITENIYKALIKETENGVNSHRPSLDGITFEVFSKDTGNPMETGNDQINRYIIQKSGDTADVIFPKGINQNIRIVVHMSLDPNYKLSELTELHAENTATLTVGINSNTVSKKADYYDNDFEFSKDGTFEYSNDKAKFNWKSVLNPTGKSLQNDFRPVFKDALPAGHSILGQIVITGYLKNQVQKAFVLRLDANGTTGNLNLDLISLIDQYWSTSSMTLNNHYDYDKPTGLSGWHFMIDYTTILTSDKQDEITAVQNSGMLEDFVFTNDARIYEEGGTVPLKQDSAEVKYEYQDLISKEDKHNENDPIQLLSYEIVINNGAKKINGGEWVRLSDKIPTNMTLQLAEVKVKNASGEDITKDPSKCSVGYSDDTRILEVSVPDETKAIVTFKAIPNGGNTQYTNTVVLYGDRFSQTSTVTRNHKVSSAGTLVGMSNAVNIKKVDKYNISTTLPGAKFEFYECSVNPTTGEIIGETKVGERTTNNSGMIVFSPVKPNTLYYWQEIQPPTDYEIASSVPHNFVVYQELNISNKVIVPWNKLSASTKEAIQTKFASADQYPTYDLIRQLGPDDTISVYIKAYGPTSASQDEYNTNRYCYLSSSEYPSATTGYESLMEEVNAVNKQEADDLDDLVTDFYGGQKIVASIVSGYTWQVENIQKDVTTIQLNATKTMSGRAMDKNEFTFYLYNETVASNSYWLQTQTSPAADDGQIAVVQFDKLSYTTPGTYKYRIYEDKGNAQNVTYDDTVYHIEVKVVRDETEGSPTYGKLVATVSGVTKTQGTSGTPEPVTDKSMAFANTYTQPAGELTLPGTKTLTGRSMAKGEFSFTVKEGETIVSTGSNVAAADGQPGKITFSPIKYTTTGDHTYTVEEDASSLPFVTQTGTTSYTVKVSVTDPNNDGNLKAEITGITPNDNSGSNAIAFTNKYEVPKTELKGQKKWLDGQTSHDNANLILLELYRYVEGGTPELYTLSQVKWTDDTFTFENLPAKDNSLKDYIYYVTESGLTDEADGEYITTYSNAGSTVTDKVLDGGTITNKKLTSVSGTKTWDDTDDLDGKRPDSVAVQLYADGKEVDGKTATIDSTTLAYEWTDLPMYNEDGTPIVYTVKEVSETNGKLAGKNGAEYTVDYAEPVVNADGSTTADITNSYAPGKTDFTATKTWVDDDNTYSTRPASLTLTLMKRLEGETEVTAVENPPDPTVTKNVDNTWTYKWEDLPERENSKTIIYSVVENTVPAGYAKSNETNAVTNTWKTGEKTVNDYVSIYKEDKARNQLKGAEFTLYKADTCEESDRIKIYSGETFTIDTADKDLEQYLPADKSKPITLYLKETKAPDGYILDETVYSVIITVDISDPTYDADKDAFITTTTYAVKINEKTSINIPNEKTYVKLSKVDATTEEELDGATIQIIDSEGNVVVEWVSEAGKPLEVTGLKTGEEYTLHETAAPNGYLVTSDTKFVIDEYGKVTGSATVSVDENGNQTLLVKDEMKKLSAAVKKVWEDDNDRDALREDSIEVKLLQNGETYDTVTLSAKNNWTYIATGLPAVDEKLEDYVYEWEETGTVEGYTATKKTEGILTVLTNTHGPEETAVTVKKAWNDNDNAAGKRPESVTVQLYADGQAAGKPVELNAANGWSATWDHLVKNTNEDGQAKPIVYTVAETEIPKGYTSKITGSMAAGYVITNTLETGKLVIEKQFDIQVPVEGPEEEELTTDIEVVKLWEDNDNRDGNRPASVTVHLYAGGTEVRSAELTAAGGWRKTFGGLPKFVDGRPIKYFVTEDPVEWYVPEIRGFTITNRYTPEVTSVTVKKVWNDEDNKRGRRPLSVAMKLNNGTIVLLSEENNWTETVTELPARVNGKPAEYSWTEQSSLGYVQENVETKDGVTVFTNKLWTGPEGTPAGKKPRTYGETLYNIGEYKTPLGVNEIINHVGDCFD